MKRELGIGGERQASCCGYAVYRIFLMPEPDA
jgi:hypothetical protein